MIVKSISAVIFKDFDLVKLVHLALVIPQLLD